MNFALSEEQVMLQDSARRFFTDCSPSAAVRRTMVGDLGHDPAVWTQLVAMGWTGIAVPEAYGGLGLGQVELAIVQQEIGRTLCASPFFASAVLATQAVLAAGSERQCQHWLPPLVAGETVAALACTGPRGRAGADAIEVTLTPVAGTDIVLNGSAGFVVSGHAADWLVVAARGADAGCGISLVIVPRASIGLRCEKIAAMDLTRPYARVDFDNVRVSADAVLGAVGTAGPALARVLALGNIALAAEQLGGAEHCLAMSVDYAKQREQFGRAIGSFQAIKHKLADMMVAIEAARSGVYYAACAAQEEPALLAEAAAVAKSFCSDTFNRCAGEAIQVHGGIGFTWEHDAQLYFKRARAAANLLGDSRHQRELIAQQLLDGDQPLLRQLGGH